MNLSNMSDDDARRLLLGNKTITTDGQSAAEIGNRLFGDLAAAPDADVDTTAGKQPGDEKIPEPASHPERTDPQHQERNRQQAAELFARAVLGREVGGVVAPPGVSPSN